MLLGLKFSVELPGLIISSKNVFSFSYFTQSLVFNFYFSSCNSQIYNFTLDPTFPKHWYF